MATDQETETVVVRRQPREKSTVVPNTVFAVAMVALIIFFVWQFGPHRQTVQTTPSNVTVEAPGSTAPTKTN